MIQRFAAGGLLALLTLTACGPDYSGDPTVVGPATVPPSTGPGTSSPSPEESEPAATPTATSADQLDEETRRRLLATPVNYYEAIERAYATLDYSEVERLSSEKCGGCQAQLEYLKEAADNKYQHEGGGYSVKNERVLGRQSGGRWSVGLELDHDGLTIKDSKGDVQETTDDVRGRKQQIELSYEDGRWVVSDIFGVG